MKRTPKLFLYDIDFELVWKVSADELSILKGQIQKIMENY